jgi:hypothetical protein
MLNGGQSTSRRRLTADENFQAYPCAAGYAWFFSDGKLSSCRVARDTAFGDIAIPAGSQIYIEHNGVPRFVFLAHDAVVKGYPCRGGESAWSTALYPDGRLKTFWLAEDSLVDNIPCLRASFLADVFGGGVEVDLHPNGRLKYCKLSRDVTLSGQTLRRGDHIRLDTDGNRITSN